MAGDDSALRRGTAQYLRSLQSAGVTHASRKVVFAPSPPVEPEPAPVSSPDPTSDVPSSSINEMPKPKKRSLKELAACVADCRRCEELASTRTQTVFGVGDPHAKILFLGEAPGADEDRTGVPFVGRAGQLLDRIITACRMKREEIYICNILKCRPPGNRNPSNEEAENCREYLDGQIAAVNPEYIVCWGSIAAKNLLNSTESIGKMRGRFFTHGRAKVLCTYHPSYLLRNPAAKKDVWEDMQFLFRDMGVNLTAEA